MDTQLDNELSTFTHRKNGSTNLLMLLQVVTREPLIVLFYKNNYSVPKGKLTQWGIIKTFSIKTTWYLLTKLQGISSVLMILMREGYARELNFFEYRISKQSTMCCLCITQ